MKTIDKQVRKAVKDAFVVSKTDLQGTLCAVRGVTTKIYTKEI